MILRGLTLWRPWAAAIVHGPKRVENRPWPPSTRLLDAELWIAVHAGRKFSGDGARFISTWWPDCKTKFLAPDGSVDGSARYERLWPDEWKAEGIVGIARVKGAHRYSIVYQDDRRDPWRFGPWCWLLDSVIALDVPIACRGAQGLWSLPADIEAKLEPLCVVRS